MAPPITPKNRIEIHIFVLCSIVRTINMKDGLPELLCPLTLPFYLQYEAERSRRYLAVGGSQHSAIFESQDSTLLSEFVIPVEANLLSVNLPL